jgi:ribonuclease HIII
MADPAVPKRMTLYTAPLTVEQATKLEGILRADGWEFQPRPYTRYWAQKGKVNVAVYEKGPKIVVQGKETEEFVRFRLEPEILGEAKLGYEEVHNPRMFEPHFGVDESGKGDFFGPLVIAGVYTDREITRQWMEAGVQDSKRIGSDARIRALAEMIRKTRGATQTVVEIGPKRYNEMFARTPNLNRLLAWGHARVIENLLEARPECPRALSDQFARQNVVGRALLERGRGIELEQRTKAESDVAVAAASVLARERFIDALDRYGKKWGVQLPRGVSPGVKTVARELVQKHSPAVLREVAKVHFKTAAEIAPEEFGPLVKAAEAEAESDT